ncbi:TRADD-N-associated membrane domain-containing protein [Blautia wexlerae]|uniref:TRADD-N-associated membrane domain-containing protein n=1 Tax=Blautia wexlerae TaxID=418240 RepID=UPI003B519F8F
MSYLNSYQKGVIFYQKHKLFYTTNLKELKEFYVICKQQIRKSFSAAMFSCFAGFVLFILAVIIFLLGGNNSASLTAGLSGAIVEIV